MGNEQELSFVAVEVLFCHRVLLSRHPQLANNKLVHSMVTVKVFVTQLWPMAHSARKFAFRPLKGDTSRTTTQVATLLEGREAKCKARISWYTQTHSRNLGRRFISETIRTFSTSSALRKKGQRTRKRVTCCE